MITSETGGSPVRVVDYRCRARRGDRPFEERHEAACISFVWSGSFGYRVGATATTLGPGALMLGNAGEAYECSHEHVGGDRCLSVLYDEAVLEAGGLSAAPARSAKYSRA